MHRRDLIKAIVGLPFVVLLSDFVNGNKVILKTNKKLKIHFVGLGGAGCNIVEYAIQNNPEAKFTFINQGTTRKIPKNVNYIDIGKYESNLYYSGYAMDINEFYEGCFKFI
jgi:hypothetical protein